MLDGDLVSTMLTAVFTEPYFNGVDLFLSSLGQILCAFGMEPASIDAVILSRLTVDHEFLPILALAAAVEEGVDQSGLSRNDVMASFRIMELDVKDGTRH